MDQRTRIPALQTPRTALATRETSPRSEAPTRLLRGRPLAFARAAWLAVAALTVALYVAGVWVRIGQVSGPCPPRVCVHGHVPPVTERALAALNLSAGFYRWYTFGLNILFALGFAAVAALLFWRRSHDPLALFISLTLLVFGVGSFESGFLESGLPAANPVWRLPVALLIFLGEMAFAIFVCIFPDGRFVPHWTRVALVATLAVWWLPNTFFPGSPLDFGVWPGVASFGGWAILLGFMGAAQLYRYRRVSTPAQRIQTKWVVFGFVAAAGGHFVGKLAGSFVSPALTSPQAVLTDIAALTLSYVSFLLLPICIAIAILRYRLFDIDLIIRRTLAYGVLVAILIVLYETCATAFERVLTDVTGQSSLAAAVAISFFVGTLAEPLRKRIQKSIDRFVFPRRYEAERRIATFGKQLRHDLDAETMSERAEGEIQERIAHTWAAVWRRPARTTEYIQEPLFP